MTSTTLIAREYASVFFAALSDLLTAGLIDTDYPIYIIELGAGHGKFSVRFIHQLDTMVAEAIAKEPAGQKHPMVSHHVSRVLPRI
jgi:hypothetical protein